jgi:opacity protein-like surface antigen
MNRSLFIAAMASALFCSASNAADLGRKPTTPQFSAQPVSAWTGFYVGVNGGYGQSEVKAKDSSDKERLNGGLLGLTLGYNYEFANKVVIGFEGDIAYSGLRRSRTTGTESFKIESPVFGTARARLGYSMGSWMPFVTAGWGYTGTKFSSSDTFNPPVGPAIVERYTSAAASHGLVLGAGFEVMLTSNISMKAEYLHANFGAAKFNFKDGAGNVVDTPKISTRMNIGRVGLNYRF